jgi:glutathione S-transferase
MKSDDVNRERCELHFATEPAKPSSNVIIKESVMILYGAPVSPFVRKVLAYAAERDIALELVPVGIGDANPDFVACSPFKKMPALKDGDFSISDSSAIIAYLEAKQPEGALIPSSAQSRARVIWYDEFADTIVTPAGGKIFFNRVVSPKFLGQPGDEAAALAGEQELVPIYAYLEGVIPASGYLVDDKLTLADIAVASPFVNAAHCGIAPDAATYPKLVAYLASIQGRAAMGDWIRRERKMLGLG